MAERTRYRDALGRFIKRKRPARKPSKRLPSREPKRKPGRKPHPFKSKGYRGLSRIRLPEESVSDAFRQFIKPVGNRKEITYAFVEIESKAYAGTSLAQVARTVIIPVTIGRIGRSRLADMSESELASRIRDALPGVEVLELHGFAHALPRSERKGKTFKKHAPKRGRKARKKGAPRRNRPTKERAKRKRSSARIRHRIHKKA